MKNKRVLCSGCNKPIKLEELGLIEGKDGEQKFYHDSYMCLVKREIDNENNRRWTKTTIK